MGTVVTTMVLAIAPSNAAAQILRLGSPRPPALDEDTYAASIVRELQDEIDPLLNQAGDVTTARNVARNAKLNLRLVTAELLKRGDRAGEDGSVAIVTALTLAHGRDAIDSTLERITALDRAGNSTAPTLERFRSAYGALIRFNRSATNFLQEITSVVPAELDRELPVVLAALRFAIASIEDDEPVSHWLHSSQSATDLPLTTEQLAEQLNTVLDDEAARSAMVETIEYLERGEKLPEFQPLVERYRDHLRQLASAGASIRAASWMPEAQRATLTTLLNGSAIAFRSIDEREEAIATIGRLTAVERIVHPLNVLQEPGPHRLDPRGARTLFDVGMTILRPDGSGVNSELWPRLTAVLDRMLWFRSAAAASENRELRGELRNVANRLERSYLDAETVLIDRIGTLELSDSSIADPAFISLLANHHQALDDLMRLRRLPEWIELAKSANNQAGSVIEGHLRRFAEDLLNPSRRQAAIDSLSAFEDQARLFGVMPFEEDLRDETEIARSLTNGRAVELLRRTQQLRANWTTMWARGERSGQALQEIILLRRLLRTMSDVASLRAIGEDGPRILNPWSAWEMPLDILGSTRSDLTNRLRFATDAALSDNRDELTRQLERLDDELPLPALVGRFESMLGDEIRALPTGAVGVIGQVSFAPDEEARLFQERQTIAGICRYALEARYAELGNRAPLAGSIREYLNYIADDLLKRLDERS